MTRKYNLNFSFNEDLHEVAENPLDMELFVEDQLIVLNTVQKPDERVRVLGLLGTYLRILRRLNEAQDYLEKSLEIIERHKLYTTLKVQQQIRLAHVYQWQKNFSKSNELFDELIQISETTELDVLHDFIWQHVGKNYYDQQKWTEARKAFEKALKLREIRHAPEDQLQSSRDSLRLTLQKMN
jgi:tetratricopeptide (TPR) repeat protein